MKLSRKILVERMVARRIVFSMLTGWMMILPGGGEATAQQNHQMVRLAKLQIDPTQLDHYKTFLKEEIETSLRNEPGVLTLYAVAEKDNPAHITILEIYASEDAYRAHLQTPHFIKYKQATQAMVTDLELVAVDPLVPGLEVNKK